MKCFLVSPNCEHFPIPLPHGEEVFVGRGKKTKITDTFVSRRQVSFRADCKNGTVNVKQYGSNASGLNGLAMTREETVSVLHDTQIEILLDKHVRVIKFSPPPNYNTEKVEPESDRKRKLGHPDTSPDRKKMKEEDTPVSKAILHQVEAAERSDGGFESMDNGTLHIYTSPGVVSRSKIAAYDMDGTLINTKSGKVFPKSSDDWVVWPEAPGKLKELHADGYKIVIFTNQAGIGKGKVKIEDFQQKLVNIIKRLGVPIQAFFSTAMGFYRKPTTGMWDCLVEMKNDNIPIDMANSFYCGDAAGRVANWAPGKKKDHSLVDRLFAENVGLTFYTPEAHFRSFTDKAKWNRPTFDPKVLMDCEEESVDKYIADDQEILVMVGYPGSGKSFISKNIAEKSNGKYNVLCRDVLGSWQKCASEAEKYLDQGKSIVVDSTNPDPESRSRWVNIAQSRKLQIRCLDMTTDITHAQHNNKFRELTDQDHMIVGDIIFYSFRKNYKEPTKGEGFTDVLKVPFTPSFENEQLKKLYFMHLLEK